VNQVATSIAAITDSVARVKGIVDRVSDASRQQTESIEQVTQTITQMERVTHSTAASAEQSAAASQQLSARAEGSLTSVLHLRAMVSGRNGQAGTSPGVASGSYRGSTALTLQRTRSAAGMASERAEDSEDGALAYEA
jgi:methyl-accepting chemotaxis protein